MRPGKTRLDIRVVICLIAILLVILAMALYLLATSGPAAPERSMTEAFSLYMERLCQGDYEGMYALLSLESQEIVSLDEFVARNRNIYQGIDASNIRFDVSQSAEQELEGAVSFSMKMDTAAGEIAFSHRAAFALDETENEYRLNWDHDLIFPGLTATDRVRVANEKARRGEIYDRSGALLAGAGIVKEVGFVPGKMNADPTEDIARVAELLETTPEAIEKKLSASYVKDNTFVPLKSLSEQDEETKQELLNVKGILINDATERVYPLGEKAAHVIGYVQAITAEELADRAGKGYHANSRLGKAGLESLYEDSLRAMDGCKITIQDADGNVKEVLAERPAQDGQDLTVTLDAALQQALYEALSLEKACGVFLDPSNGEVLALVSTPAYDPNDFVLGMSEAKWQSLSENQGKPFYNRFKATHSPGSSFKPIVAAIGLSTGSIGHEEDFGLSGRSWQKDASWGAYTVTTLKEYAPATMRNALVNSDNIYFAKAALKIGSEQLADSLKALGFEAPAPFEFGLTASTLAADGRFENEIQLADSGYGQGKILINPLHMASLYSAFYNSGSMVSPHLIKGSVSEYWKSGAFRKDVADAILSDMIEIVESPNGTAHEAARPGKTLAAKTGTSEIKQSKDDETGTELGWFNGMTLKRDQGDLLFVVMIEDVKGRGGSHFVIPKVMALLDR